MRIAIGTSLLFLLVAGTSGLNPSAPKSNLSVQSDYEIPVSQNKENKSGATGMACQFDFGRVEATDCVLKSATGGFYIVPEVLKQLTFDSYGLAAGFTPGEGWIYVARSGKVIVTRVTVFDNGADEFHDGLVRFVRNEKFGFSDRKGHVAVAPTYDGAMNFEKGRAKVCKGCVNKCAEPTCEHHWFSGGEWFLINTKGAVLKRIHPDN